MKYVIDRLLVSKVEFSTNISQENKKLLIDPVFTLAKLVY